MVSDIKIGGVLMSSLVLIVILLITVVSHSTCPYVRVDGKVVANNWAPGKQQNAREEEPAGYNQQAGIADVSYRDSDDQHREPVVH